MSYLSTLFIRLCRELPAAGPPEVLLELPGRYSFWEAAPAAALARAPRAAAALEGQPRPQGRGGPAARSRSPSPQGRGGPAARSRSPSPARPAVPVLLARPAQVRVPALPEGGRGGDPDSDGDDDGGGVAALAGAPPMGAGGILRGLRTARWAAALRTAEGVRVLARARELGARARAAWAGAAPLSARQRGALIWFAANGFADVAAEDPALFEAACEDAPEAPADALRLLGDV